MKISGLSLADFETLPDFSGWSMVVNPYRRIASPTPLQQHRRLDRACWCHSPNPGSTRSCSSALIQKPKSCAIRLPCTATAPSCTHLTRVDRKVRIHAHMQGPQWMCRFHVQATGPESSIRARFYGIPTSSHEQGGSVSRRAALASIYPDIDGDAEGLLPSNIIFCMSTP
ncbi:hypothetical protein ASPBRDRAFT_196338 [Aspergillus brasiliensis CBS 101740]|uniref:Uncharacterized protein n=1 Tax=Aspergillus brasiliensis (strain CBS 101740 / IMI 381727 / IBT 21946) TaxID=767769 RepID=A0A1L9UKK0_ASPBC|nr:hypothetical protein ASPBRDRAFT_196338 [Aspergillus brasiliensis CBS 101740]